jgi:membrane protein DedA with SNARE-associated domain
MNFRKYLSASLFLTALPALAWSHPGHGLDGLWAHDLLHGATAVVAIVLIVTLTVRFVRIRKHRKRS